MGFNLKKVTYQGYRTSGGWEVIVRRPGQPVRPLDLPERKGEWAWSILRDYFQDQGRAADLHQDFASLTTQRFTEDWELSERDIENALQEVDILRARWRIALARN